MTDSTILSNNKDFAVYTASIECCMLSSLYMLLVIASKLHVVT